MSARPVFHAEHPFDLIICDLSRFERCPKCNELKTEAEFYEYHSECKECRALMRRRYAKRQPAKRSATQRKYREKNRERSSAYMREWNAKRAARSETIERRERYAFNQAVDKVIRISLELWREKRPQVRLTPEEKRRRQRAYERERLKNDPAEKLKFCLRRQIYKQIKGIRKTDRTMDIVGCTAEQLKQWIESQFIGCMSWENYGKAWHVDHRVPCSYFDLTDPAELKRCFHYTNLRPLWAKKNIRRQDKAGHVTPGLPIPFAA